MTWYPWNHPNLVVDPRLSNSIPAGLALFAPPTQPLRPLRAMVDAEVLERRDSDPRVKYLLELLAVPPTEAMLYRWDGPPSGADDSIAVESGVTATKGWVSTEWIEPDRVLLIKHWRGGSPVATKIRWSEIELQANALARRGPESEAERTQLLADARALAIADGIRTNLYITDRQPLVRTDSSEWTWLSMLSSHDAIPMVGLYLRRQDRFVTYWAPALGGAHAPANEGVRTESEFYWQAARLFVPAAARGPSSHRLQMQAPLQSQEQTLRSFDDAVVWRVQQALQARDRLFAILAVAPRDALPADRAASQLELILMWFMAALDVTARSIHLRYRLPGREYRAAWQSDEWRGKLKQREPTRAGFFDEGTPAHGVLTIIQRLRNSIHGANAISAQGLTPIVGANAMQTFIRIPPPDRDAILPKIAALGGHEDWGVARPLPDDELMIHPGRFVERLFPLATAAINATLEHDPDLYRRATPWGGPYELQLSEKRILWQFGFQEGDVPER